MTRISSGESAREAINVKDYRERIDRMLLAWHRNLVIHLNENPSKIFQKWLLTSFPSRLIYIIIIYHVLKIIAMS